MGINGRAITRPFAQKTRYICWDADDTLGRFDYGKRNGIMKGLVPLLESLRDRRCRHILTTAASETYARIVMEKTGLRKHFDAVFSFSTVWPERDMGKPKIYSPVAEHLGLSESEARDCMIAVGNTPLDLPRDLDIVTLYHPQAIKCNAEVLGMIFSELFERRSWGSGYLRMLKRFNGQKRETAYFEGGDFCIGNKVTLTVGRILENPWVIPVERVIMVGNISTALLDKIEPIRIWDEATVKEARQALAS
jgi:hypothetical protein